MQRRTIDCSLLRRKWRVRESQLAATDQLFALSTLGLPQQGKWVSCSATTNALDLQLSHRLFDSRKARKSTVRVIALVPYSTSSAES